MPLYPKLPAELKAAQDFWMRFNIGTRMLPSRKASLIALLFRAEAEILSQTSRIAADGETISRLQLQIAALQGSNSDGP